MESKQLITCWNEIHTIIEGAMQQKNRQVSIYISPDGGMSVNVSPWPDEESLREAMDHGKISYNDYRKCIMLEPVTT